MLIIPLHQPLTLARFPWVTAALILINVLVYFGLQARDQRAYTSAAEFYQRTGLIELELPWLQRHLRSQGRDDLAGMLDALGEPMRSRAAVEIQAMDREFAERIRGAPFFEEGDERLPQWRANRAEFEAQLSLAFTPRHALLFHDPTPWRHFSSMFLHGDVMHLIGNMVFLALLGLMTEAALGPWLFLGVYVIGGFGAGLVSVLRHFGEFGSLLGASGAIAALMGACCVVWGMRKVRVFYWFFVIFDYVKVPALFLLPVWLGWELWQMWSTPDSRVAFDAHAGGIITGALATFAIRKLGWERREAMDEDAAASAAADLPDLYGATRSVLGKLEFAAARELSERLVRQHPNEREAWRLRMRAWRDRAQESAFHEAARRLLVDRLTPNASLDEDIAQFNEYLTLSGQRPRLSADDLILIGTRWLGGGRLQAAEPIVMVLLNGPEPNEPARKLAVRLALSWHEAGDQAGFQRIAGRLYQRCPDSPEATRLQRLLGEG